ncbi:MAG: hypothetical protein JOZ62_11490 [Acidobacteriaceae bacterium]|nr:hypothetical protein [Acidobacteriaceae bacterium]
MNTSRILYLMCASLLPFHVGAESPGAMPQPSVEQLKRVQERIAQQEDEIKKLENSIQQEKALLERAMQSVPTVEATGNGAAPLVPAKSTAQVPPSGGSVQHETTATPSPLSIRLGNSTLTPLGFMDATYFTRTTNVGSGIGTNFAGIPYGNAAAGHIAETSFSAQNSRVGFRVDSNFLGWKVLGYLESDFLFNNNAGSFQITSNSAGFRLRNYFVDVQRNGFEMLGGQDWTFLTPNRKGLSPIPSDIFYSQNMDTNYQLGLTWSRQPQFRFIAHPNENVAFGVSFENPQQYIGGGAGAGTVVLPAALASLGSQFQSGGSATGVPNLFPDIIPKVAIEGHPGGRTMHVEAAGLIRGFKDYLQAPAAASAVPGSHTAIGYGGAINSNLEIFKNIRLIENAFFSDGGGRYIFGVGPDVVIRTNGTVSPVHSYSTVDGFEAQVSPNSLLAAYYGGAYIGRDVVVDANGTRAGYGFSPASATASPAQNRCVQEITLDWVQTLWKNPNYGALSLINQYSYLWREPWAVASGTPKQAHTNMIWINLRYTLP